VRLRSLFGHDHTRHILKVFQQPSKESFGGFGIPPRLNEDAEHDAVLIHPATVRIPGQGLAMPRLQGTGIAPARINSADGQNAMRKQRLIPDRL
jgi:hypothetical protein